MQLEITANPLFRLKTQQQIAKDFAVHGYEFELKFRENPVSVEELYSFVSQAIVFFLEKKQTRWQALLYTIDFSENEYIKTVRSQETGNNTLHHITLGIVQREAKKVFFREKYSGQ